MSPKSPKAAKKSKTSENGIRILAAIQNRNVEQDGDKNRKKKGLQLLNCNPLVLLEPMRRIELRTC